MILLKLIKWGFPLVMFMIPLFPFLNGIGCNFTFVSNNSVGYEQGTCKEGVLSVYIKHNDDGKVFLKRMRWGYYGDYIYTYPLVTEIISSQKANAEVGRNFLLFSDASLLVGKISAIKNKRSLYVTFFDHPVEILSINKIRGNLGFLDKITNGVVNRDI